MTYIIYIYLTQMHQLQYVYKHFTLKSKSVFPILDIVSFGDSIFVKKISFGNYRVIYIYI